ncbi:unnamed protein product [Cunninghamella blakesleeana]
MQSIHINQVQNLVQQLYTSVDTEVTKSIQEQLQAFQKLPEAWEIASQLLSIESDQCKFFGAHTYQVKIVRDWDTLPTDRIDWLKEELCTWIIKCSNGPDFVTRKLCIALISFAFQAVPLYWQQFIPQSVNALISGAQVFGISEQSINNTILEFLTLIPEEVSNIDLIGGKKMQISQELNDSIPLVLTTLSNFLFATQNINITTLNKSLKCFQSWLQYGIDIEKVIPILQQTMLLLNNDETFESAADVLLEGMQQPSWAKYNSFRDELLSCFTSDSMKKRFTDCINEDDEEIGKPLAKLFTTFIETFTDFISVQLARYDIKCLMEMVLQLTGFHGYYPVDQEISEIPLNVWYVLQETLYDNGVIPIRYNTDTSTRDGDDDITLDASTNDLSASEKRLWLQQCGETAIVLYSQLVTIIKQKAIFPDDNTWSSWAKDLKDKFRICRRDLGDTIINSYYVLRGDMLRILFDQLFLTLNNWNSIQTPHLDLEAILFCLKSVSEEIPANENDHISKLFESNTLELLASENNPRLQVTALSLMGALAEWLKGHPQYLVPIMNYIVPRLGEPKLSFNAASAFSNICDVCRESLIDGLDSLMHVYGTTASSSIEPQVMKKVVESVASVIQVLPPDRLIGPLMILTGSILRETDNLLNQDLNQNRNSVISQLENLSSCCRGIQAPTDDYQSLSMRNDVYDSFASGQLISMYIDVNGFKEMNNGLTDIIKRIGTIWSTDEEVMKSLSQFLEAGIRSTSPLLTLSFEDLIILIENGYKISGFASWLDISSFVMTVYGGQESRILVLQNFLISLTEKTLNFISKTEDMEQYPDVIHSYFNLLSRIIQRCPNVFYNLPINMINTMILLTIAGMGLQERLALKSALNFMADFVSQDLIEGSKIANIVNNMITNLGLQIMEQLIAGIGGRVPRSFSKPLVDVLYKLTGRYLQHCRQWLSILLYNDGFPSTLVTKEDKDAFLKGVLGQRSLKRFKDCTNEFSKKCRGLGNTAFGYE